jgi:hypothetical protein
MGEDKGPKRPERRMHRAILVYQLG